MTVSSTQSFIEYQGDGATNTFPVPFYFLLNSDISAMLSDINGVITDLVYGVDFTVTGAGSESGGLVSTTTAYPQGSNILIYRTPPATQETKYYENGKFPAKSHETALDKLTMLIQGYHWSFDSLSLKKPGFFADYYNALNNRISNVGNPALGGDATPKSYVDSGISSEREERVAQDAALQTAINDEAKQRQDADANIQSQLTGNTPLEASAFSEISWHGQTVQNSVVIPPNKNAWSFGPTMTIAPGQSVTVGDNSSWTIANGEVIQ